MRNEELSVGHRTSPTQWKNPTTTNKKEINKDQPTKNKQSHKQTKIPNSNTLEVKCFTFGFGTWMSECEEQQWITINCNSDKRKAVASIVHSINRQLNQFFCFVILTFSYPYAYLQNTCDWKRYLCLLLYPYGPIVTDAWSGLGKVWLILSAGFFLAFFSLDLSKYCTKECSFIGLQTKTYI